MYQHSLTKHFLQITLKTLKRRDLPTLWKQYMEVVVCSKRSTLFISLNVSDCYCFTMKGSITQRKTVGTRNPECAATLIDCIYSVWAYMTSSLNNTAMNPTEDWITKQYSRLHSRPSVECCIELNGLPTVGLYFPLLWVIGKFDNTNSRKKMDEKVFRIRWE